VESNSLERAILLAYEEMTVGMQNGYYIKKINSFHWEWKNVESISFVRAILVAFEGMIIF
jgi:hypothetical protein